MKVIVDEIPMSVLEDIKAEIKQVSDKELTEEAFDSKWWGKGLRYALRIIDKHIESVSK